MRVKEGDPPVAEMLPSRRWKWAAGDPAPLEKRSIRITGESGNG